MKQLLTTIDRILSRLETTLIIAIVTVMVLMAFLQVFLRNFFDSGILWGDIFLRHLVLWVGFIGASLATRDEKHISIDALSRIASPKILPYIRYVTDLFTIFICIILARAGWKFVQYEKGAETILFETDWFGQIPAWTLQLIIPVGFGLIAFRFLLKILERLTGNSPAKSALQSKA